MINNQIYITSVVKAINKAKKTGNLDLRVIQLFDLYKYYINFTENKEEYIDKNICLKQMISELMYKYSDILCNYKVIVINNPDIIIPNIAPTCSSFELDLETNQEIQLTVASVTNNFNDVNGDSYSTIKINPIYLQGSIYYNNVLVTEPIEINVFDIINIKYVRWTNDAINTPDYLVLQIADNHPNKLYSNLYKLNFIADEIEENLPPTIGDNTIYVDNRAITVFTLAMLTSELTPPYNDPEGDLIDAIRIDEISTANEGVFYLNNTPITVGLIITREDIIAGLLEHRAPDTDSINSDVFSFSARDEGNGTWIS